MTTFIIPILLLGLSAAMFFGFIDPTWEETKTLSAEAASYDQALDNSKELQKVRDALLAKYNTFPRADVERIQKLLPDSVDNVRLVLDIDRVASKHAMTIRNVRVADAPKDAAGSFGPDERDYGSVILTFSVTSSYANLIALIRDLESSLRLVDITSVVFRVGDKDDSDYAISVRTYWLK